MDDISTELAALKRQLAEQVARVDELERALAQPTVAVAVESSPASGPSDAPAPSALADQPEPRSDRRQLLLRGGALAAAAVAGAATLAEASPAAADNGDPLAVGQGNNASSGTSLVYDGGATGGFALLSVSDTNFPPTGSSSAIWGWASEQVSIGVRAQSTVVAGTGLAASASASGGTGVTTNGVRAALRLDGVAGAPPTRLDSHTRGEIDIDSAGDVWLCVSSGIPGGWRKIGGPDTAGAFHVLASTNRIYDSRPGLAPFGVTKGVLSSGNERVIDATVNAAIPTRATAAVVNLTVTDTSGSGFLALFKNGVAWPGNSSVNWAGPGVVANLAVVALDLTAKFKVRCDGGGSTQFLIDVIGYYR